MIIDFSKRSNFAKINILNQKAYIQGTILSIGILILGLIAEFISKGTGVIMPSYPVNFLILIAFIFYILVIHFFWKSDVKKWLSGVPATVTAITSYAILVVLMGFILQQDKNATEWIRLLGLSHINKSWEFLFISIYLLTILGLVVLRRLEKFDLRNIAFFLNHAGMFIVISAASVATGDLQRLTLPLAVGQSSNYAYVDNMTIKKLPFSVKLDSFAIRYFSPKMIVFNPYTKQILNEAGVDYSVENNKIIRFRNLEFKVKQYYNNGIRVGDSFIEKDTANTEYAALLEVNDGKVSRTFWASSGNYRLPSKFAIIEDKLAITLDLPEDKKYISTIEITDADGKTYKNKTILVNKPFKFSGYNIYQQSYEMSPDGLSKISILELVKDPWLSVIYVGLTMLFFGALLLFLLGKKI